MKKRVGIDNYLAFRKQQVIANVRKERQVRHISQAELERLIGCSRDRIANIEAGRGRSYLVPELEVIARYMGMNLDDLTALSSAETDLSSKYETQPILNVDYSQENSWLKDELSTAGELLKPIYQKIFRALPGRNGTLAYSIVHPDDFLANHILQGFETKGEILKLINLKKIQRPTPRNFLAVLLGPRYRQNANDEELLERVLHRKVSC